MAPLLDKEVKKKLNHQDLMDYAKKEVLSMCLKEVVEKGLQGMKRAKL